MQVDEGEEEKDDVKEDDAVEDVEKMMPARKRTMFVKRLLYRKEIVCLPFAFEL